MTSLIKKQEIDFSKLVDNCSLSPEEFEKHLDMGVEMLFYIEEGTFDRKDIQNVVFAIKRIIDNLKK
ncbi:hypothetical protein [Flavivirga rizhaonensis]|uniref:Uncharacterized protein n=1 Tax=Flavivirga rizhaonensis TaxID=2559571 RepID=A0A4S1DUV9_9FLAO|nr:hypothetical protein [Flavivirga rizhaonensis]TGV01643.1 hypothetical protein EM932_14320 [Flavivirga rizhaonensis]